MSPSVVDRPRESPWPMISVEQALDILCRECSTPFGTLKKSVSAAVGHVLAEDVCAVEPHPPFRASIMDGYAVIASDGAGVRRVLGASAAGDAKSPLVQPGTCVRVSTGAPVPEGADAVVKVEDTRLIKHDDNEEQEVEIKVCPKSGQDIRAIGCDIAVGECVLQKGTIVHSAELGVLCMIGRQEVLVHEKANVAVVSTGNELLDSSAPSSLSYGQVRDSNRPQLHALMKHFGFETIDAGIISDEVDAVRTGLASVFAQADVLITTGGVSMGEKDLLKSVLTDHFGFTIHFARVKMKPGKPTTFATGQIDGRRKFVFALPGNPVSSWVCAHVFVSPALRSMIGHSTHTVHWPTIKCKVQCDIALDPRVEYQRAVLVPPAAGDTVPCALTTGHNQMSSRLTSATHANVLLKLPAKSEQETTVKAGALVDALVIGLC